MLLPRPPKIIKAAYTELTWSIPNEENKIYLTFDDGPTPEVTAWTLDLLKKFDLPATFFCVGKNVVQYPDVFKQIVDAKHGLGNHTFSHANGWKTKNEEYYREIEQCSAHVNSRLFRPPYGRITKTQAKHIKKHYQIVMWDVLSGDFNKSLTPNQCVKNVIKNTKPGSIIVFHDSEKAKTNLMNSLPSTLEQLLHKGFVFDVMR